MAAHTEQGTIDALVSGPKGITGSSWIHRLTVEVEYRNYSSFRHFVGTVEQTYRGEQHTQVHNHVNLFDVGINYQLTPRWSLTANIPAIEATRHGERNPGGIFRVGGVGDIEIGAQAWVFRPPTESGGDVAFDFALKLPTGINNATGANANGQIVTADQSVQPGDGTWGFTLGTQAYHPIWFHTMSYFEASYLFNPENTNGIKTYRSQPHEGIMSVYDQYLVRAGVSHMVPKIRHMSLSLGGRMEGIPVRDAFGGSDGFRRPGYIISLEPGLMYNYRRSTLSIYGPWALERNRTISTSDRLNGSHGDAAFSDYSVIVSLSHHF